MSKNHEPRVEMVDITPVLAAEWLTGHNRALRPTVWMRYARDMASGSWVLNGETIKRTVDGQTSDGQHRLKAIVESGRTVRCFVAFDLPADAQETVDRGLTRNTADALRLRGEKDVNNLSAAIAQVTVMRSPQPGRESDYWPSTTMSLDFLDANPSIRDACLIGDRVRKVLRTPASTAAAIRFITQSIDEEDSDTFFASLINGVDLDVDSPILRLREFMVREVVAPRRVGRNRLQAYYIKAWNAYREGKPVAQLKWKTGGAEPEKFPVAA